jgi:uncharacterized protein (DUF488 family)
MNPIYTVGYTSFQLGDFVNVLKSFGIQAVIDVRSQPNSEHYPNYDRDNLNNVLNANGIQYRNYIREFGARQNEKCYFSPEGILDFEKFTKSNAFLQGYNKIAKNSDKYTFALMCAEKKASTCHRSIMITRIFSDNGYDVKHILQDGCTETQRDIETQLLEYYFPNRNQLSLMNDKNESDESLIKKAYQLRNAEIGYKLEGNEK